MTTRTRLHSKATRLCNGIQSYREGGRTSLDSDQLALKLHHLVKLQIEMQNLQGALDKLGQTDETNHMQVLEDEVFLGSRVLARLERAEQAQSDNVAVDSVLKCSIPMAIQIFHGDIMQ